MNACTGRVVSVLSGDRVVVAVDAEVACARCAEGRGCGAGLLGQGKRDRLVDAVVSPDMRISEGDTVDVLLEPSHLLRAAGIVYGQPLLAAVLMAALGWLLGLPETATVLMAVLGLGMGLVYARHRLRVESCLREFTPTVVLRTE